MKKYLLIILFVILCPCIVLAENTCEDVAYDEYCKSSSSTCLSSLQREYNTWNTTNNTGIVCIKVIAQINGNTRSYLNGRDPEINYKCSDGSTAVAERIASAIPYENEVTDCTGVTCYVPEIWKMDCGTTNTGSTDGLDNTNGNLSNNGGNVSDNEDSDISNEEDGNNDVSTNSDGQITGTTDTSDTGVETYFIVLFVLVLLSYVVLMVSKKKNLFKSI